MVTIITLIGLFILGAALGSFAVATVWRLRYLQLKSEQQNASTLKKIEYKIVNIINKPFSTTDRSKCLHCGYELRWFDMIPVVSWIALRGKCRRCHKPIGYAELAAEIGLGVAVAVSYAYWPLGEIVSGIQISLFVLWVIALVLLTIHFFYDLKWYLLPDIITVWLVGIAVIYAITYFYSLGAPTVLLNSYLIQIGLSLVVLPGFYGLLYVISKGNWIGFGDVKLLVPMALFVASWQAGVLLIFLANLIGCLVVLPGMLSHKLGRTSRIPFGPFLILAFIITMLLGSQLVGLYLHEVLFKP